MSSKSKEEVNKLVLVLAISILVTAIRKKTVETAKIIEAIKTAGVEKDGKDGEGDEYPKNLVQFLCICYLITF